MAVLLVVLPVMSSCGGEEVAPTVIISPSDVEMSVGDVYSLEYTVFPKRYADMQISWLVSDSKIIDCKDGRISAKAPGVALVYAVVGTARHSCKVTVTDNSSNMIVGESVTLSVAMQSLIKDAKKISVLQNGEVSDVLSYEGGTITANKTGMASVVATFENGDALTLARICVRDIHLTCEGMPLTVEVDHDLGISIEAYGLEVFRQLYATNNYAVSFAFKYKLASETDKDSVRVDFKVVLYSSEVEGEFCRERIVSAKLKPGEEYEYVDSGFYAMLGEEGDRHFWIEIVPVEEEEE